MKDTEKTRERLTGERPQTHQRITELEELLTDGKRAEQAIREAREYAESIVATVREPLLVLDADLRVVSANRSFYLTFGLKPEETQGRFIYDLGGQQWDIPRLRELLEEILPGNTSFYDFEVDHSFPALGHRVMVLNARWLYSEPKKTRLILLAIQDVTEKKRAEERLSISETRYRRLFETAQDGILILDAVTGEIIDVNPFLIDMLGYPKEEFVGKRLWEIAPFQDIEASQEAFQELQSKGYVRYEHLPLETKNGHQISVEFVSNVYPINVNGDRVIQCNIRDITERVHVEEELRSYRGQLEKKVEQRTAELEKANRKLQADITERKQAAEELKRSEERYRFLAENARDVIYRVSFVPAPHFEYVSPSVTAQLGYTPEECYADPDIWSKLIHLAYRTTMSEFGKSPALPKGPVIIRWMRKDGTSVWAENSSTLFYDENGKVIAMQGISRDVTERVQAEQLYRTLTGSSPVGVYTVQDNKFVFTNPKIQKDTGYTEEELLGKDTLSIIHPEDRESARKNAREMLKGKRLQPYEYRYITKTGETRWALENVVSINYVGRQAVLGTPMDITERRQAEEALKTSIEALMASERRYRTLFESAAEGILIADIETKQFKYANPAICRMLGYSQEEFKEMALGDIHPKDSLKYVVSEFEAQAKGKKTLSEGIPCLRKDGKILYADIKTARALLDGTKCNVDFFADVSERRLAEEERRQNTEKLLKAMDATIKVLAMTVEIRDPYTAGHQQRVSSLATSIAQEMELPAEQIEGIRIAGVVHDIGKMNVPSEILSKPGRLNESEFDIIRMHPQASYDILKIVEFPWPIAQIVLQHHERMDGSGYPGHLSGKDIILEARVLAVADVVEAMASHRPYRPALGIDKAVEEISQKMGVLYDSEVVNACLKLFNEKRFKFDEEIQSAIWSPVKIG